MKRISIFVLLFICFFFVKTANATSGACSYHGGVNCAAGADLDGSVICNDGWTDSSVQFSQIDECMATTLCSLPIDYGCKTEGDYGVLETKFARDGSEEFASQQVVGILNYCRNQINKYQADLLAYNNCLANSQAQKSNSQNNALNQLKTDLANKLNSICTNSRGANSHYDETLGKCACDTGYFLNIDFICSLTCSNNSSLKDGACSCDEDSIYKNGACLTYTENCQASYGPNSYGDKDYCYCSSGYSWNSDKTACIITIVQPPVTAYATSLKNNLNIRQSKSATSKVIGTMKKKTKYEVVDSSDSLWIQIKFGGKTGWVMKKLVIIK